jgi:endonuclease-3
MPSAALREKAGRIQSILDTLYPAAPIPLEHEDPFQLLVAVVLSAQCTDARVNLVTPALFAAAPNAAALAALPTRRILQLIRTCGLAPTKARNLRALAQQLVTKHGGAVPKTFAELEALPGVGHKTASVVLAQGFGIPALPVDTHIHRLATRWGLTSGRNVTETERDLKALFSEATWSTLHLQLIYFGREHCPALRHDAARCTICSWAAVKRRSSKPSVGGSKRAHEAPPSPSSVRRKRGMEKKRQRE